MNSTTFPTLKAFAIMAAAVVATGSTAFAQADQNQKTEQEKPVVRVSLDSNGVLTGYVFAMLDDEQAPMLANVTLAAGGKTVASGDTDVVGQFSFKDVEPGEYTMVGVSGEYTGNQTVVVMPAEQALETEEAYASVGLQVAYDNEYAYAGGDAVYGGDVLL
jgi:hypothetical protein